MGLSVVRSVRQIVRTAFKAKKNANSVETGTSQITNTNANVLLALLKMYNNSNAFHVCRNARNVHLLMIVNNVLVEQVGMEPNALWNVHQAPMTQDVNANNALNTAYYV